MTRRKIIWQFWKNPFGYEEEEFVDEEEAHVPSAWEEKEEGHAQNQVVKIRPVIPMATGFMPIQPFQNFSDSFQFWMGHTNFNITHEVKEKIEETPGVEILDIITRYCFRIAVGKAFNGVDVKQDIMKALNALPPKKGEINPTDMKLDKATKDKVALIQTTIRKDFPFWVVYVLPNGEIDVAGTNTRDAYDMHLDLYSQCQELAGGIIYQYA